MLLLVVVLLLLSKRTRRRCGQRTHRPHAARTSTTLSDTSKYCCQVCDAIDCEVHYQRAQDDEDEVQKRTSEVSGP